MATLSSWTNDGRASLSAARYALRPRVGRRLSAARYAHWPWYDVLRSTFYVLAEEGAAVLAGPSPLPYYRVLIIYIS